MIGALGAIGLMAGGALIFRALTRPGVTRCVSPLRRRQLDDVATNDRIRL